MCTARAHCAVHVLMLITVCEHFWVKGRKMLKDMGGFGDFSKWNLNQIQI